MTDTERVRELAAAIGLAIEPERIERVADVWRARMRELQAIPDEVIAGVAPSVAQPPAGDERL
jgi:hypothetical protein